MKCKKILKKGCLGGKLWEQQSIRGTLLEVN